MLPDIDEPRYKDQAKDLVKWSQITGIFCFLAQVVGNTGSTVLQTTCMKIHLCSWTSTFLEVVFISRLQCTFVTDPQHCYLTQLYPAQICEWDDRSSSKFIFWWTKRSDLSHHYLKWCHKIEYSLSNVILMDIKFVSFYLCLRFCHNYCIIVFSHMPSYEPSFTLLSCFLLLPKLAYLSTLFITELRNK